MKKEYEGFERSTDNFGPSYQCKICGKNQFYTYKPNKCNHKPQPYETAMFTGKSME